MCVTTTVLIADDEMANRAALRHHLRAAPEVEVLGEATDGVEAVAEAHRLRPDVVLMDLCMPRVDGVAATRLLAGPPAVQAPSVIALATADRHDQLFTALRAGAAGFLLKNCDPDLYVQAVRHARLGHGFIDPQVTRRLIHRLAELSPDPPRPELQDLTPRELQVLRHLAEGLANRDIARRLNISEGTVKIHVNRVLSKLRLGSRVQAAVYAYRHGIATLGGVPGRP